jgi:ubiquilin
MSSGDSNEARTGEEFELFVRLSSGNRLRLRGNGLSCASSVADVKAAIEALLPDAPVGSQRLIYKGRILDDDSAGLGSFGVVHQSTLFLVGSRASANSASPAATATSATSNPAAAAAPTGAAAVSLTSTGAVPAVPPVNIHGSASNAPTSDRLQQLLQQNAVSQQQQSQGQPPPLLAAQQQQRPMTGIPGIGGPAGNPPGLMEPWMQRLMRDMDPNVLANVLHSQLESNPALQRLMDQNPQLRHMMTDPAALQQAANMLRNPEAMQQAMRQQDLALSQLENMPGGFAALSSMYSSMQAPLEESLMSSRADSSSTATGPSSSSSSSQIADEGAAGTAMPNPWGSPPSSASARSTPRNSMSNPSRDLSMAARNPFLDMLSASSRGGNAGGAGPPPLLPFPVPSQGSFRPPPSAASNPWANLGGDDGARQAGAPGSFGSMPPLPTPRAGGGNPDPLLRAVLEVARQNPDQLREAMQSNPTFRAMFGENMSPQDVIRLLEMALNPAVLEMMQQFEGLGGSVPGGIPGFPPSPPPGDWSALMSAALQNPAGTSGQAGPILDFSALLQGMTGGGGMAATSGVNPWASGASLGQPQPAAAAALPINPRDRYRRQLQQLAEMGFDSEAPCLAALQAEHGNLNRAVDRLLSSPPAAPAPAPQPASASSPNMNADEPSSQAAEREVGGDDNIDDNGPPAPPKDATDKKND